MSRPSTARVTTDRPAPDPAPAGPSVLRRTLAVAGAVLCGVGLAVQSRINGELGLAAGDGLVGAAASFGIGLLLMLLIAALSASVRRGVGRILAALRETRLRWWQLLGGLAGASMVASQNLAVGITGVAVFTVAVVAGQTTAGLLVDRAGLGPGGRRPVTASRVIGAVLALTAVALTVAERFEGSAYLALALLPALAGAGLAWQQAVNGRVSAAAGGPLPATVVNFVVGTTGLVAVALVSVLVRGLPGPLPADPLLYLGAPIGVLYIAAGAALVPVIGVLLLALATVAGQVLGALLLDVLVPAGDSRLTIVTVAGALLTLVAVVVVAAPWRRPSS